MASEFDALFAEADSQIFDEFSETVTRVVAGLEIQGIYGNATKEGRLAFGRSRNRDLPIDITGPYLEVKEVDGAALSESELLQLSAGQFDVVKVLPDGTGLALVQLLPHDGDTNSGQRWK